jgi:glycosyltransferase involved in cell wall biosynthesis
VARDRLAPRVIRALAAATSGRGGRRRDLAGRRRRITFLTVYAYATGGVPRAVFSVANELADRGHDVEVVSVYRSRPEPYVEVHPAVRVTYLEDRVNTDPAARILPRARRNPQRSRLARYLDQQPSRLAANAYPAFSGLTDLRLLRKLRSLPPGIVVATRPELAAAVVRWAPPDVIAVNHEHLTFKARPAPIRAALFDLGDRLDALVSLTEADLKRWRRRMSPTTTRFAVIPNATPFAVAEPAPLTSRTVITAGRLARQKAFDRLIDAFAPVSAAHPDWELHIYGNGRMRRKLLAQIERLGLVGQVRLMGFTAEFEERLGSASMYAMSSRYEGFPMVLLEAMSKGVPPVSVNCPEGPRQLIKDGTNGLLVGRADVRGLSHAMQRVIEDPVLRRRLGTGAMQTARDYTIERVVDQWETLFDDLVARRESRPRRAPSARQGHRASL